MTEEENAFEILGRKITIPRSPESPRFPWEELRKEKVEMKMTPKPARRRFVRKR
jgi:hypothetical protein